MIKWLVLQNLSSTKIVSSYFNDVGINNTWINVKEFIKTNNEYRDANS